MFKKTTYLGENKSPIIIPVNESNPPAPAPCTALPTTNMDIDTAAPQSALPRKKTAAASSRMALRPQISLNLPQLGMRLAAERRKADPTQT